MNLHKIKITGIVNIKNGDNEIKAKNHMVINGMKTFLGSMVWTETPYNDGSPAGNYRLECKIGNDTSTATSSDMTSLVSPLSPSITENENNGSISGAINSGSNYIEVAYTFNWNSGTITGTLGEVGLFNYLYPTTDWINGSYNKSMTSRLSSADGDFSSFVIDDTVPLTIDWTLRFEFV